ncbi:hypothetical protein RB195_023789 [Necator americanus]|uniref:Mos1 transposase HTH domain-containing protein n=1 Tax=Necator americanus TaxID=51031 RepID=A0ABR1EKK3_NECAM
MSWYSRFRQGIYTLEDELRSVSPSELNLKELRRVMKADPSQSTREISSTLGTVHGTGVNRLQKLCRYVLNHLRSADLERQKPKRSEVGARRTLLDGFLSKTVFASLVTC